MVSICRLCASLKKTEILTFIRDSNHELCHKLSKCCQLSIDLKDVLPKGVCPECVRRLNASFEFYERVHESQQSLEKLLNVDSASTSSKSTTEMVIDDECSEERTSLAMVAAAIVENVKPLDEESSKSPEQLITIENDDSSEVTRVINEILGAKDDEQSAYSILGSDIEEESQKPELIPEKAVEADELNNSHESFILPGNYDGIEFIDEDEEEIDFEHDHYEIIEEEDAEEEETPAEGSLVYEIHDVEDSVVLENEDAKVSPSIEMPRDSWTDYPWTCVRCLIECTSSKHLIEHNQKVHQIGAANIEWYCADCQKTHARYYTLINHIRQRHRTTLALLCDICNERCKSFKDLEEHRRMLHRDEAIPIMILCVTCGKGFHTTNSLQIHSKCHLPDEQRLRYTCTLCDKKFRTSSNLKFHQKMHAGTRDYVCDQCGKKFVQRANLEEHLVTHVTYTPYVCSLCDKFFKTPERLTRHKQRHTDDKPFNCTECDKTFRTKDAKNTHMRIHTGEMPFSCEFCQKPFRFRSTLMTHHNVHTGTRPYSCAECNHHFTNWPNYNKHMKRRHGIDVSSKNPRGRKPANPAKPLVKSRNSKTPAMTVVKREADPDIRSGEEEEDADDIVAEYVPEEEINITLPKQEKDKPDDNYEDAI